MAHLNEEYKPVIERYDDGTVRVDPNWIVDRLNEFLGENKLDIKTWKRIANFNATLLGNN